MGDEELGCVGRSVGRDALTFGSPLNGDEKPRKGSEMAVWEGCGAVWFWYNSRFHPHLSCGAFDRYDRSDALAVKIRLKRMGRRHRPFYRLVAIDKAKQRDGRVIEELGYYDPINKDSEKQLSLKQDRIEYWLSVGALPSETVHGILRRNGILEKPFNKVATKT